ncbi:MAG: hypothetical protein JWM11_2319, partial [Planctomycetaceae bacterium]|nr:hypothetical protein [Planctomycetaceae bacterium]
MCVISIAVKSYESDIYREMTVLETSDVTWSICSKRNLGFDERNAETGLPFETPIGTITIKRPLMCQPLVQVNMISGSQDMAVDALATLRNWGLNRWVSSKPQTLNCRSAALCFAALVAFFCALVPTANSAEPAAAPAAEVVDPTHVQFFEQKVRPLLVTKCIECHGPQKQKAGLRLDSREAITKGGDTGAAISPDALQASLLLEVISYKGDLKMPPKSKLTDAEIADLTRWVKLGAPWTKEQSANPPMPSGAGFKITPEQRAFWAFQPIADPPPPAVQNTAWIQSPLDRFVLAELESQGLQPAPPADKRTLIRRITIDLTGLPPTPLEIADFMADSRPDSLAQLVDRLLDSPRYGERWARHWLDVARYADSNGLDENLAYANAFRYRDYVVRAFNQDKPFHEFMREQIAGDLLPDSGNSQMQQDR